MYNFTPIPQTWPTHPISLSHCADIKPRSEDHRSDLVWLPQIIQHLLYFFFQSNSFSISIEKYMWNYRRHDSNSYPHLPKWVTVRIESLFIFIITNNKMLILSKWFLLIKQLQCVGERKPKKEAPRALLLQRDHQLPPGVGRTGTEVSGRVRWRRGVLYKNGISPLSVTLFLSFWPPSNSRLFPFLIFVPK